MCINSLNQINVPRVIMLNHLQQEGEGLPEVHMPVFVSTNSIVSDEP